MRARADFAEPHIIAFDKQLHAKHALAAQIGGHGPGNLAAALQRGGAHRVRLPAFNVIAADLDVANRLAKMGVDLAVCADGAHGELRDLIVKVDKALDDDAPVADAPARHRAVPSGGHIGGRGDFALALAGRTHHRLDDAGVADFGINRHLQFGQRVAKHIGAGRQIQGFGGQATYAFAVHRQSSGARRGNHTHDASGFEFFEHGSGNRFDFGHDQIGLFGFDQDFELGRIAHRDGAGVVRHLLAGRVVVAVHGDGFDAQALQCNQDLLAQLAGAEQHDFGGVGGQRGSEGGHRCWRMRGEKSRKNAGYAGGPAGCYFTAPK